MNCHISARLIAAFAVWALLCVVGQQFLGAMQPLTCCAPACSDGGDSHDSPPVDQDQGCSHAYCCHTSVAVDDGSNEHLVFQPLIAEHEWREAACAVEGLAIGIEHPPQIA
jgi:hypothetical protein